MSSDPIVKPSFTLPFLHKTSSTRSPTSFASSFFFSSFHIISASLFPSNAFFPFFFFLKQSPELKAYFTESSFYLLTLYLQKLVSDWHKASTNWIAQEARQIVSHTSTEMHIHKAIKSCSFFSRELDKWL